MQRRKGHDFERVVADVYRKTWKTATVRRSLQAHQPFEPDVVVEGHLIGERLWTECQCSNDPTPMVKLLQAERDVAALSIKTGNHDRRLPIVVWKRSGTRAAQVTTRMWVIRELGCFGGMPAAWHDLPVTLDFAQWLGALDK